MNNNKERFNSILIDETIIAIFILGSKTLQRRKLLMENEKNNIDNETGEERYDSTLQIRSSDSYRSNAG